MSTICNNSANCGENNATDAHVNDDNIPINTDSIEHSCVNLQGRCLNESIEHANADAQGDPLSPNNRNSIALDSPHEDYVCKFLHNE